MSVGIRVHAKVRFYRTVMMHYHRGIKAVQHKGYAVVRLSPLIEAVGHTSIPPTGGFGKLLCDSMMFQYFWWIFTVAHNCCKQSYLCNIISHALRAKAKMVAWYIHRNR